MAFQAYYENANALEDYSRSILALEHYRNLLETSKSPFLNDILKVSIESINPGSDYFDIPEDSKLALRNIGSVLADITKKVLRFILKAIDFIKSIITKLTGTVRLARGIQVANTRKISKVGNKSIHKTIKVSGAERLSVNGEFVGLNTSNLNDLKVYANFFITEHPKAVVDYIRDTTLKVLSEIKNGNNNTVDYDNIFKESFKEVFNKIATIKDRVKQDRTGFVGKTLPGNRMFQMNFSVEVSNFGKLLQADFGYAPVDRQIENNIEIPVPKINELKLLNNKIGEVIQIAESARNKNKDIDNIKVVIEDTISRIAEADNVTDDLKANLVSKFGSVINTLNGPKVKFVEWLAVTLHIYTLLVKRCVLSYDE